MAEPEEQKEQSQPDKTIGKQEGAEATNGTASEEEQSKKKAEQISRDIANRYGEARRELNESINRLRNEMAQFNAADARNRARDWVEENPALTAFLAIGAGIVVGKLLSKSFRPPPPPTLGERLRSQSRVLSSRAHDLAQDVGAVVSVRASEAGERIARKANVASSAVSRHARELGDVVARRAEEIADTATDQAAELGDVLAEKSHEAARNLRRHASDATGSIKETASDGFGWTGSALNAAKTVAAAYVVKRVTDWVRHAA